MQKNRKNLRRATRRCAWTVLPGTRAPAAASQGVILPRHAWHRWSTLLPRNLASRWKHSRSTKATGARRPKATPSLRATTPMPVEGERRGRTTTVPQGTTGHVRGGKGVLMFACHNFGPLSARVLERTERHVCVFMWPTVPSASMVDPLARKHEQPTYPKEGLMQSGDM